MKPESLRVPLAELGEGAWIVGGGLRDVLLGREPADVDVAVTGDAASLAARLARSAGAGRFRLSAEFGAWRVSGGRLPYAVDITPLQDDDLLGDLARRDLTVNAMALPVVGPATLVDPFGGRQDLARRRLAAVRDDAFQADPVRVLRAGRLAVQLGFALTSTTTTLARAAAPALWGCAPERLRDELYRAAQADDPEGAFRAVDGLGALGVLVPQLEEARGMGQTPYHHLDVLGHTLEVVRHTADIARDPEPVFRSHAPRLRQALSRPLADGLTRREGLVLAALLHDMAKPATRTLTREGRATFPHHDRIGAQQADALLLRLRCATRVREMVRALVRDHLRLGFMVHRQPVSLVQVDRLLHAMEPAPLEQIVLSVADRLGTNGRRTTPIQITRHLDLARQVLAVSVALEDRGPIRPVIPADQLAERLGRRPGPWLAELLRHLREVQLVRTLTPERTEQIARIWCERHHPKG